MSQVVRYRGNEEDRMSLLNNVFIKIIDKIENYKLGTSYKSWISQIMRNEIIDDYRKNKKRNETIEFKEELEEESTTSSIETKIEEEELEYYLNMLPPAGKMVFNLYVIEGYSSKEICEKLEIGQETFKWHLKEARKKLRLNFKKKEAIVSEK
jgi:RNA polymerase sigma-70 factor (ECF subfamily)